jgi:DNA invertase Pin-like site-specific DNA recombinase
MDINKYNISKVAVYVRVSTLDQEKGIRSQEHAIERYLEGHSIENAKWYRDRLSGKDINRPGFEKLQKAIFNGQVGTVIVWKLDRLSRSMRDGVRVLCDWIDKDVRVVSVSQQLDFSGTVGKMIASVLFAVAEMERENPRENTKRGLALAKAKGVKLGRRSTINAEAVVRLMRDGMSLAAVGRRIGKTPQAIYVALRREGIDLSQLREEMTSSV